MAKVKTKLIRAVGAGVLSAMLVMPGVSSAQIQIPPVGIQGPNVGGPVITGPTASGPAVQAPGATVQGPTTQGPTVTGPGVQGPSVTTGGGVPGVAVPSVPSIPNVGQPSLPSIGQPSVPSIPNIGQPSIPNLSLPAVPSIPNVGQPSIPSVPDLGQPSVPNLSLPAIPSVPDLGQPSVPNLSLPAIPSVPDVGQPALPSVGQPAIPDLSNIGQPSITTPDMSGLPNTLTGELNSFGTLSVNGNADGSLTLTTPWTYGGLQIQAGEQAEIVMLPEGFTLPSLGPVTLPPGSIISLPGRPDLGNITIPAPVSGDLSDLMSIAPGLPALPNIDSAEALLNGATGAVNSDLSSVSADTLMSISNALGVSVADVAIGVSDLTSVGSDLSMAMGDSTDLIASLNPISLATPLSLTGIGQVAAGEMVQVESAAADAMIMGDGSVVLPVGTTLTIPNFPDLGTIELNQPLLIVPSSSASVPDLQDPSVID